MKERGRKEGRKDRKEGGRKEGRTGGRKEEPEGGRKEGRTGGRKRGQLFSFFFYL